MALKAGAGHVSWFNRRHRRTGTLWEDRFKSSLVDSERYLLTCYRYIEMNPVRAAMVDDPADYAWSSHAANARDHPDPLGSEHPVFTALAPNRAERCTAYRELFQQSISDEDLDAIRRHVQQQRALGSPRFQAAIEDLAGRRVSVRPPGRPVPSSKDTE